MAEEKQEIEPSHGAVEPSRGGQTGSGDSPRHHQEKVGIVKSAKMQKTIVVEVYRRDTKNAELCERLVDLDEGVQEWRYRHVKMVERTIGMKRGTGGSAGAEYLRTTIGRPAFPDLWEIRTQL